MINALPQQIALQTPRQTKGFSDNPMPRKLKIEN